MARVKSARKPTSRKKRPAAPSAEVLQAQTTPPDPGPVRVLVIPRSQTAGVRVNEDTALTFAAVYACVKVISETIACLPWHVMRQRPTGGSDLSPSHPVDWLLHFQADPEVPAFIWRECIVAHTLLWGNGYAEIERDAAGRPVWLHLLTPDRVYPDRDDRGRLIYVVCNPREPDVTLFPEDIYHCKGLGFDGLVGYSVIAMAARSVGFGISMNNTGSDFFANDSTPGGILSHPAKLSEAAIKNVRDSWERLHAGAGNRRRVAVLQEGMTWTATGMPAKDSEFIASYHLTIEDICRFFRVQPHKIMHLLRSTFSNIEQQSREHVVDTLLPWVKRLESEADIKLFGRTQRGTFFTKMNLKGLLRGDVAAQTAHYQQMLDRGVYDVNEVREMEDLNPVPFGDKRLVQLNMTTLEKAGEEPEPAPTLEPPAATESEDDETESPPNNASTSNDNSMSAIRPVLLDACGRIVRREALLGSKAAKRLADRPDGFAAWVQEFVAEHGAWCGDTLRPGVQAAVRLAGLPEDATDFVVEWFVWRRQDALRQRTPEVWAVPEDESQLADRLLTQLAQAAALARD